MFSLSALNDEIKKKRKTLLGAAQTKRPNSSTGRPGKRWRALTDIEDFEYEEKARAEAAKRPRARSSTENRHECGSASKIQAEPSKAAPTATKSDVQNKAPEKEPPLSKPDVVRRLRALKQPATLFGEDPWDRFNRLRELELSREEHTDGQRNFFQRKLREVAAKDAEEDAYAYAGAKLPTAVVAAPSPRKGNPSSARGAGGEAAGGESGSVPGNSASTAGDDAGGGKSAALRPAPGPSPSGADASATEDAIHHKEDYVAVQMARYMRLWRAEIDTMDKQERRTNRGRTLLVTYEQTKHWLEPLEQLLRRRKLSNSILLALRDIFEAAAAREYTKATRLYLERLAIGNAPWPMGATQVGIHSRAAREKIGEDKIAHVMNDEQTRKYIQAVKRLITVAQRHFPTDFSKMVVS